MNYYGIYAQHLFKIPGGRWVINDGIRFQAVDLRSTIADNSAFKLPFTEIRQENTAVTGNIGAIYMPNEKHRITFGLSSGFRAPNIDDAARIFESSNQQLVVPNENIKPEYTYNADISLSKTFGPLLHVEINGFHTWFRNAIALSPFSFNGSDTVLYNNARVQVLANQNVNKAVLYGGQISLRSVWSDRLSAIFTSSYTRGRYIADPNALSTVFVKRANGNYVDSSIKSVPSHWIIYPRFLVGSPSAMPTKSSRLNRMFYSMDGNGFGICMQAEKTTRNMLRPRLCFKICDP
jgi:hemoglobin/transferrin/lactoferrin receptor protein